MNNQTTEKLAGSERRSGRAAAVRKLTQRVFRLDGGYVILDGPVAGAPAFSKIAAQWPDYHVTAIAGVPDAAGEWEIAELGRAAQAFDRVLICESGAAASMGRTEAAARFARAVRSTGRTECLVVADAHRALRHCVDGMVPGEVIAYCCGDVETAARILAEYGALPVRDGVPAMRTAAAGTHVALNRTTGSQPHYTDRKQRIAS
jgi:hypothetical protein